MNLHILERITDNMGYLMLNETGAIIASGGDLENDEQTADVIFNLISMTDEIDKNAFPKEGFNKISVTFDEQSFVICLSNKKIHVIKRRFSTETMTASPAEPHIVETQIPITNSINA